MPCVVEVQEVKWRRIDGELFGMMLNAACVHASQLEAIGIREPFRSVPFCSSSRVHNIMRPCMCSVGSMTLGYVDYILRVVEQAGNIRLSFTHSDWTWRFGWSYTLGTMHRNQCLSHVIRRKHYSSQHYSLESLFIITIIIENTDIVHSILTIQTDIVHYSYLASLSSYFPSCFPWR